MINLAQKTRVFEHSSMITINSARESIKPDIGKI